MSENMKETEKKKILMKDKEVDIKSMRNKGSALLDGK